MAKRTAQAGWNGSFKDGSGTMAFGDFEGPFSAASRIEDADGTNPEELIAAAHAGCFAMALTLGLNQAGQEPESIETEADVHLNPADGGGFEINRIDLRVRGVVPGIDLDAFREAAEAAKRGCPVSKALAGVPEITLDAQLAG